MSWTSRAILNRSACTRDCASVSIRSRTRSSRVRNRSATAIGRSTSGISLRISARVPPSRAPVSVAATRPSPSEIVRFRCRFPCRARVYSAITRAGVSAMSEDEVSHAATTWSTDTRPSTARGYRRRITRAVPATIARGYRIADPSGSSMPKMGASAAMVSPVATIATATSVPSGLRKVGSLIVSSCSTRPSGASSLRMLAGPLGYSRGSTDCLRPADAGR